MDRGTCILHANCRGVDERISGKCIICKEQTTISHGHLASPVHKDNITCRRCSSRR